MAYNLPLDQNVSESKPYNLRLYTFTKLNIKRKNLNLNRQFLWELSYFRREESPSGLERVEQHVKHLAGLRGQ